MDGSATSYAEQIFSCLMHSLPSNWSRVTLIFTYDENSVLQHGTVWLDDTTQRNLHITHSAACASDIADMAMLLRQAMFEEFGKIPCGATFSVIQGQNGTLVFAYQDQV